MWGLDCLCDMFTMCSTLCSLAAWAKNHGCFHETFSDRETEVGSADAFEGPADIAQAGYVSVDDLGAQVGERF